MEMHGFDDAGSMDRRTLGEIDGRGIGSVESLLVKIADKLGVAPPDPSLN